MYRATVRFRHGEIHIFQLGRVLASRVPLRPAISGKATLSRQGSIVRFGRSTVNERILTARSELVGDSVETRAEAVTPRSLLFVDLFRVARFRMAAAVQLDLPGKARAKVTEERETRSPFHDSVSPGYRAALLSAVYTKYLIKRSDERREAG